MRPRHETQPAAAPIPVASPRELLPGVIFAAADPHGADLPRRAEEGATSLARAASCTSSCTTGAICSACPVTSARTSMVWTLICRGLVVGLAAGLLAFAFAFVFGEPQVQDAIDIEEQRARASTTCPPRPSSSPAASSARRAVPRDGVYGIAAGGLFAIAFAGPAAGSARSAPTEGCARSRWAPSSRSSSCLHEVPAEPAGGRRSRHDRRAHAAVRRDDHDLVVAVIAAIRIRRALVGAVRRLGATMLAAAGVPRRCRRSRRSSCRPSRRCRTGSRPTCCGSSGSARSGSRPCCGSRSGSASGMASDWSASAPRAAHRWPPWAPSARAGRDAAAAAHPPRIDRRRPARRVSRRRAARRRRARRRARAGGAARGAATR